MMIQQAPILLFVYNRPVHTQQAVAALLRNELAAASRLYIYSDAAKTDADRELVEETRRYVRQITGFASIDIIERKENWGLARNIIDGVTTQVNRFGRVIVLEDDLIVAPYFLQFMNDALEVYKDEPRIGHIQACDFTNDPSLPDIFLIKFTGSWGWATWDRAWKHFNPDGEALLKEMETRKLTRTFDFNGNYPFTRMLRRQIEGKNNSWAIRTNCGGGNLYQSSLWLQPLPVKHLFPIEENRQARSVFARYYHRTNCFMAKAVRRLKRTLKGDFGA